jgi:hypothetical protein
MRTLSIALLTAVLCFPLTANVTIIEIPNDYPTIQEGIDQSADGDTVLVWPGTWYENLDFDGHKVVLASLFLKTRDTVYISRTTIDGSGVRTVIHFWCGEDSTAQVVGFTIQNGHDFNGGGICCWNNSSPTIRNNVIVSCCASKCGGGVYCKESSPTLRSNTIRSCSANHGGGIFCWHSDSPIGKNIITSNSANEDGGGVWCGTASPLIDKNTISRNSAAMGGGVWCGTGSPQITNTILWGDTGPEIYGDAIVRYSDVQGGWPGQGNIDSDPLFADPERGDFHLQWGSPCIDAGDPSSPPDPDGTRTDMGAFHFPQPPHSPQEFDFSLLVGRSCEKVLSIQNVCGDTLLFSLLSDVNWISFLPDSGCILPDSSFEVSVIFDGSTLPLGPNHATIWLNTLAPHHGQLDIPVAVHVFCTDYTYISLTPDSLPITIPAEGGSFIYWAETFNATDFTYHFDLWVDATLPNGQGYGPIHKRRNYRFRPQHNTGYHLTQYVPGYAPPGQYSYNFKMGALPDQVDYQDSFGFTKLEAHLQSNHILLTSWELVGWGEGTAVSLGRVQDQGTLLPTEYSLSQNYPNPFNTQTSISYSLAETDHVTLKVYDLTGRLVAALVDGRRGTGEHSATWDASQASSGVYFYVLRAGNFSEARRMVLLK